jgi:hypothetical protein
MWRMTTESTVLTPYRVFVHVPAFVTGLLFDGGTRPYVNVALGPEQLEASEFRGDRVKLLLSHAFTSILVWFLVLFIGAVVFLPAIATQDQTGTIAGVAWAVFWLSGGISGWVYIDSRAKATARLVDELTAQGLLFPLPGDSRDYDLLRISKALMRLHGSHGSAYDARAREAVAAVIHQDRHRPEEKQLSIARSNASDAVSAAIRQRALEAEAAWGRDVANAEQLILELEEAAGIRTRQAA